MASISCLQESVNPAVTLTSRSKRKIGGSPHRREGRQSKQERSSIFRRTGISGYIPSTWSADGTHVIFSASRGDSSNLWQIPMSSKTWQVVGPPRRLTFGTGVESQPSVAADGRLVFSSLTNNIDIWSLPIDPDEGTPNGEPKRLTEPGSRCLTCTCLIWSFQWRVTRLFNLGEVTGNIWTTKLD